MDLSFSDLVAVQKELLKRLDTIEPEEEESLREFIEKVTLEINDRLLKIDQSLPT